MVHIKKSMNSAGECEEKREPSCTVAGNADWNRQYGEQCESESEVVSHSLWPHGL